MIYTRCFYPDFSFITKITTKQRVSQSHKNIAGNFITITILFQSWVINTLVNVGMRPNDLSTTFVLYPE